MIYEVAWQAFGISSVQANSEEEALQYVSDGCFNFDDHDFERTDVDGVDVRIAD